MSVEGPSVVFMEMAQRTARQVADELVELLAAERAMGARKAALIAELADHYDGKLKIAKLNVDEHQH